jgi:hypothetical protein
MLTRWGKGGGANFQRRGHDRSLLSIFFLRVVFIGAFDEPRSSNNAARNDHKQSFSCLKGLSHEVDLGFDDSKM